MNEILLWRAVINNAVDCSLDMRDPGLQQEEIDWFYTDHYDLLYKLCYGVSGDSLRERLEPLWEDIERHPLNAAKYRRIFAPHGGSGFALESKAMKMRGKKIKQPRRHNWERPRNEEGRFVK